MIKSTIVGNQSAATQSSTINDAGVGVDDKDSARVVGTNQFGATRPGASLPGTGETFKGKDPNSSNTNYSGIIGGTLVRETIHPGWRA